MLSELIAFSTVTLGDFCSSIAVDISKKKALSFLEEQGKPIINHHLARALIRALSGSLIEQLNAWRETPDGKENKDYAIHAIKQLQVISNETNEKNADWTAFLEKFNSTALNQSLETIRCNQPIQALDLGKKAMESLHGFFSDPAQNQRALSNFCDFLCKEDGAIFNCNLYERFREEIIKDPVTFDDFTIHFLSQIYTGVEHAFPNSKALADTLSNIAAHLEKIEAKVDDVEAKIEEIPEKTFKLFQNSGVLMTNREQGKEILKMLTYYNSSELPKYPEKLKKFVTENRADELRKALTYLKNHRVLLISGVGGVGKSTLARAIIDLRPTTISDPFWFSFYDNQDAKLEDILEKLASYLSAPEILSFKAENRELRKADVDILIGELHRRSEVWLIFDDLSMVLEDQHFADKEIELLFSSLRFQTHNSKVIITSRILPILENGESLLDEDDDEEKQHLGGLETCFAVDYLVSNGLNKVGPTNLEKLAKSVDGHPLALKLLVKLVKKHGAANILSDLSIYQTEKEDAIKKARKLFIKLAGDEKELLERISVYREPVKWAGLKKMFNENTPKNAIDKLIDKSLLETDNNRNYLLHSLIQEFSYEDLKRKKEAHLLAVKYYLSLPLPKNPTKKEDLQSAIEAHHHACKTGMYDLAADVIWESNLHYFLNLWGNSRTLIEIGSKLLPKDYFRDEPLIKNKQRHVDILKMLGIEYEVLGETNKAIEYFDQAIKISRKIRDKRREGKLLVSLGIAYKNLGETEKAIECYNQEIKISREMKNRHLEGTALGNLGVAYKNLGEPRKAIECYDQSIKFLREISDRRGEEKSLGNLGSAYSALGETKKAIEYYEQALKISREIEYKYGEGATLVSLGLAYYSLNEPKIAIEYYEQALKISREIKYKRGEGAALGNLGSAYSDLGETKKAIEFLKESFAIGKLIEDSEMISLCKQKLKELERPNE